MVVFAIFELGYLVFRVNLLVDLMAAYNKIAHALVFIVIDILILLYYRYGKSITMLVVYKRRYYNQSKYIRAGLYFIIPVVNIILLSILRQKNIF